jgi:hypothetical protein
MPRFGTFGSSSNKRFGFTSGKAVSASYLIVAGGGGTAQGGGSEGSGGGGAGGLLTGTTSLSTSTSYTITVGAGGTGGGAAGSNGSNSTAFSLTAIGGGNGGKGTSATGVVGGTGGSGGGSGAYYTASGGLGTSGQGSNGGTGSSGSPYYTGGGGGGASAVGANGASTGGNGGAGTASSITGSSVTYAGGGGGGAHFAASGGGTGGAGGGGNGGFNAQGTAGTANTGGGGGGSGASASGAAGGSGIVIISYTGAQQFGGGTVTSVGGNTIHTFTTSGVLSPISSLSASYLIVAGGGSGGSYGGGGGAGGLLSGSGVTIDTASTYLVTVGAGGASNAVVSNGSQGSNSSFSMVATTAIGGGYGGYAYGGGSGGSGGGAAVSSSSQTAGSGTPGQGNAGGANNLNSPYPTGGGGGAGAVGAAGAGSQSGAGGIGSTSSISGTSTYYAGGGGGGATTYYGACAAGAGGNGGGGAGGSATTGTNATANTGGGGGGGGQNTTPTNFAGGSGGSGIVIISYAGATQQMAGGTVTITGGNVIHTFTSSGYLTPLTLVGNSLRFRSSASASLTRTYGTPTNSKIWSFSAWIKRGKLGANQEILNGNSSASQFYFTSSDTLYFYDATSGADYATTQVFRDPAAWYHIVVAMDTTQATAGNRTKIYVNGVQVTAFGTATTATQNNNSAFNVASTLFALGVYYPTPSNYFDGYLTNINFIDGQQLTPNSFGTFNSYGVWQPITYGGSYGTNGFYLPFTNNASTTTLGYDFSPASNHWTTSNVSVTAGATYDSMTDVPTLTSNTASNYCVLNPLSYPGVGSYLSNANLTISGQDEQWCIGTMGVTTGKWYWEVSVGSATYSAYVGVINVPFEASDPDAIGVNIANLASFIGNTNYKDYTANSATSLAGTTKPAVWGVALDLTAGTISFYVANTLYHTDSTLPSNGSKTFFPMNATTNSGGPNTWTANSYNFGQRPFTYTPPAGYVALNTYNL